MRESDLAKLILSLVCNAIQKEEVAFIPQSSALEWEKLFDCAGKNLLIPLLHDQINKMEGIPQNIRTSWKAAAKYSMLVQLEKYKTLKRLLSKALEHNITFVLLKGCVLADLYPNYASRISCDTDIFIYPHDRDRAVKLFEEFGYIRDINQSNEFVYVYMNHLENSIVEMHLCLWENDKGKRIELLESLNLTREESLIKINACDMEVVTLGYEEHLTFQIYHIIKHFTLQGITMRYLIDITLYINQYEHFIDFTKLWTKLEQLQYDKFCETFFGICVRYLKMSSNIIKNRNRINNEFEEDILLDLMKAGSIYEVQNESWQLSNIIEPYYSGKKKISNSGFLRKVNYISMMYQYFSKNYKKKRRLLLPFAWIYKCFSFIIRNRKNKLSWNEAFRAKLSIVDKRLLLMKDLGLEVGQDWGEV